MATIATGIRMMDMTRVVAMAAVALLAAGMARAQGAAIEMAPVGGLDRGVLGGLPEFTPEVTPEVMRDGEAGASRDATQALVNDAPRDLADEAKRAADPARPLFASAPAPAADARPLLGAGASSEGKGVLFGEVLPTAAALGATLLAIVLARSVVRRFGGAASGARGPSGVVAVLARYPLARGQQIVLLEVGRRILVTHQTAQAVTTLGEVSDPDEVADLRARCEAGRRGTQAFSFDALLRGSAREFDAAERAVPDRVTPRGGAGRAVARAPEAPVRRGDVRSVLPEAFRSAEIETVDLTRQGARR